MREKKYAAGRAFLEEALAADPRNVEALRIVAICFLAKNNLLRRLQGFASGGRLPIRRPSSSCSGNGSNAVATFKAPAQPTPPPRKSIRSSRPP